MAEKTSAFYRLVTIPFVYRSFQNALGGVTARDAIRAQFFPDVAGKRVLEVGCGPGNWAPHLADTARYVGIDWNADHIAEARTKHASERVEFHCGDVAALDLGGEGFDYVFAFGLLHHLDDDQAGALLDTVTGVLDGAGAFVAVDPVYHDGQNRFARWMNDRDSGQNIRRGPEYDALVANRFAKVDTTLCTDKLRVPYSHYIMVCREPMAAPSA